MLHAVALILLAGFAPSNGGLAAVLAEVRAGGPGMAMAPRSSSPPGNVVCLPALLPQASFATGRIEKQDPAPVASISGGGAAKALPDVEVDVPMGDPVVVAVSADEVHAPGGGAYPWRPG